MSLFTTLMKENEAIAGAIPPQSLNNTNVKTEVADASLFNRINFVMQRGTAAGNLVAAIYQSQFANGSSPTLITGPNQNATTVGNTTGNLVETVECRSDQLTPGANPPYRYVYGQITESAAVATVVSGVLMLCEPRYGPQASDLLGTASPVTDNGVDQRVFVN